MIDETYRDLMPHSSEQRRQQPHQLFTVEAEALLDAPWQDYLIHLYSCEVTHSQRSRL